MDFAKKNVLILEDCRRNQNTICRMLTQMDIQKISVADNVFVASLLLQEASLQNNRFDFIIV